jgi:YidC/Oxa1 family membrane protein insertase
MILSTVSLSFTNFIQVGFGFVFKWLYDLTSNYALTLFLFALVVKVILLPLSAKQKKTMMKTSRLAPQLKALEIACGDDKAKYQQEMMALYKEEGVSMTGGCVWSLIPMFILIPLYYVIREPLTYVLRMDTTDLLALKAGAGTANAAYWQLAVAHTQKLINFNMFGINLATVPSWKLWKASSWNEIGQFLIPVVSGGLNLVSMLVSQKMNNTVIKDDKGESDKDAAATANKTGKSMMYMMPLMSVFFGFIMPAGLSIYWIAQAVFGIVQDYFLTVHYRKIYDAEDAVKREKAAQKALEEAEKEKLRAQRRAENPEGILENTSKKKLEQKQRMEREAAAREYAARTAPETQPSDAPADAARPFSRGRAYQADRYRDNGDAEEETKE